MVPRCERLINNTEGGRVPCGARLLLPIEQRARRCSLCIRREQEEIAASVQMQAWDLAQIYYNEWRPFYGRRGNKEARF